MRLTTIFLLLLTTFSFAKNGNQNPKTNLSGSDSFGYTFKDTNEPNSPPYSFADISQTGTLTNFTNTDDGLETLQLEATNTGKTFNFYGNNYSTLLVSTNGWLSFDLTYTGNGIINFPATGPNNTIAVLAEDLDPAASGDIFYLQDDANDRLIIQWENVPYYNEPASNTRFQVILDYATNNIFMNYDEVSTTTNGTTSRIGIENLDGTISLVYYNNVSPTNVLPTNDLSLRFLFPQIYNLQISSSTFQSSTTIGSNVNFPIKFKNTGSVTDNFSLALNTSNAQILQNGFPNLQTGILAPNQETDANLLVNLTGPLTFEYVVLKAIALTDTNQFFSQNFVVNSPDQTPPAQVENLTTLLNGTSFVLNWTSPTTNFDGTLLNDGFSSKIYKGTTPTNLTLLTTLTFAQTQTFTDTNPQQGANYYAVTTVDQSGNEAAQSNPLLCNFVPPSGGLDPYGYAWKSSIDGQFSANFYDVSQIGTDTGLSGDDENFLFSLPFAFEFYGNFYTQIRASTNGLLTFFYADASAFENTALPYANTPNNLIAPFWDDLKVDSGGKFYFYSDTLNQRVIFQWDKVYRYSEAVNFTNTFQAILYQNGEIEFQYQNLNAQNLTSATIGTEDSTGAKGLQLVFNSNLLQSNLGIKIYHVDINPPKIISMDKLKNTDNHLQNYGIYARVSDLHTGINPDSVEIFWRFVPFPSFFNAPMVFVSGDSFYGEIPALNQLGVKIEYYVSATDASDSTNTVTNFSEKQSFDVKLFKAGALQSDPSQTSVKLRWQEPENNAFELKFDDATSEFQSFLPNLPAGLNSPGSVTFATKFNLQQLLLPQNFKTKAVKLYFANGGISGSSFKIKIFADDFGNGKPGTLLFESQNYTQSSPFGAFKTFEIPNEVLVGDSTFFVGVEQVSNQAISLGGDTTLAPPYNFSANTHFVKQGTTWSNIENLVPVFGEIIPMIRCFVEPIQT
ncbi:hypothetical protein IT568_12805, partial [bacterium]|nr:hypothetical protein [bacterium]